MVLATLEDDTLPAPKWAFVTSRRVGNAVTRNRIRRRLRGILARHGERLAGTRYLVMIARHPVVSALCVKTPENLKTTVKSISLVLIPVAVVDAVNQRKSSPEQNGW